MPAFRLNNRNRPEELDGIDDPAIQRQMERWVSEFGKFERSLKKFQTEAEEFVDLNDELNRAAGQKKNDRSLSEEAREKLDQLVTKTAAVHDAVRSVLR